MAAKKKNEANKKNKAALTFEERHLLAATAVNRLIAGVEAGRFVENKELAEAIYVSVRESAPEQHRNLQFLLKQQELERPDLEIREYIN